MPSEEEEDLERLYLMTSTEEEDSSEEDSSGSDRDVPMALPTGGRFMKGFDPRRSLGKPKNVNKTQLRKVTRAVGEVADLVNAQDCVLRPKVGTTNQAGQI